MWTNFVTNPETISTLFKDHCPSLANIVLHEMILVPGPKINIVLRFDIDELPDNLPAKWQKQGVNKIQLTLGLLNAQVNIFNLDAKTDTSKGSFELMKRGNHVVFVYKSTTGAVMLNIKADVINVNTITGYKN